MNTNDKERIILPMIPLRGLSVFPYMVLHFDVGREKSIDALEEAMMNDQLIFLSTQINPETDIPSEDDFYKIGTVAKIKQMLKLPGDAIRVLVEGLSRGIIEEIISEDPHFKCKVIETYEEHLEITKELEALMRTVLSKFEEYLALNSKISPDIYPSVASIEEPGRLADVITSHLDIKIEHKQEILEAFELDKRLDILHKILIRENEVLKIERDINIKVRSQINKVQKEYYLKEQLRAIQEELGQDNENTEEEIEEYLRKLNKLKIAKKTKEKVKKEINRLSKIPSSSAESGVIRSYIEWILELPWNKQTSDKIDIKYAQKTLNEDHFGLDKVKERVLEYLAVRKLSESMKGPILCLVGPPGVGKTSIAKSISRALKRNFVRMSLGGVRDEAEIRGHRRTYIGAIPGRIISAIKDAESNNPVFLFDEVDKIGTDFRGDPASALLEVLDPEQNKDFTDHYLEVPFDLSNVMFVTTANTTDTIPRPLLDRMEVIDISGYTEEEKVNIAQKYLVPKQKKEHGLSGNNLSIQEQAIRDVINYYTRESGVRNLERQIANICRKAAKKIVEENIKSVRINPGNLEKYLGKKKYRYDKIEVGNEIGVTTGLAWTIVGGDTLSIETTIMDGSGKLVLTGQLGDVMQESAKAGISYIRSKAKALNIDGNFYKDYDIHIHIPEGATPKDGPSAGVTMGTSVISALSKIPTDKNVAMTGEITLRGKVLPVGGIKEKVLAAHRAGIKKVLLPHENEKDIDDIPENVRKNLEFVLVDNMDEVLQHALIKEMNQ